MSSEVYYRSWMDKPHLDPNTNLLTEEYVQGIGEFMRLVQQQPDAKSGFSRNYKVWYLHGETGYEYGSTSEPQPVSEPQPDIRLEESRTDIDYGVAINKCLDALVACFTPPDDGDYKKTIVPYKLESNSSRSHNDSDQPHNISTNRCSLEFDVGYLIKDPFGKEFGSRDKVWTAKDSFKERSPTSESDIWIS
ncbi:hypothetical protein F2Q68_00024983 [Brassica cretica]|uniref:Uncharacterized protein n=1 Tax=Brassica cretica TaxID=69181 RepID=A0A8S9I7T9_BRACR|nr:hypothetical protein F2Q68_00024983 [Brassica cretica]